MTVSRPNATGSLHYRFKDIAGLAFGRLTALSHIRSEPPNRQYWLFLCSCGKQFTTTYKSVANGASSCGCSRKTGLAYKPKGRRRKYAVDADSRTPEYKIWTSMNRRCSDTKRHNYHRYGGRGIKVCDAWRDSFPVFLADMGERPSPDHSLDRYPNNDGNYEPGNCRWATAQEQARNRSKPTFRSGLDAKGRNHWGFKDITGMRFGRLVVLSYEKTDNSRQFWLTKCDCGKESLAQARQMVRGYKKSCGCMLRESTEAFGNATKLRWQKRFQGDASL